MLSISNLAVSYGNHQALFSVSLNAHAGQIFCVTGPNGAGKSTLINAIYGSTPSSGSIMVDGTDVGALSVRDRARAGIRIVPQGRQIFMQLTVRENLQVYGQFLGVDASEVDRGLERFPVLKERAGRLAGVLSGGEQQMLSVSRALMGETPKILLLDEPVTGLAPRIVNEVLAVALATAAEGSVVVIAEPTLHQFRTSISAGCVLLRGTVAAAVESGGDALEEEYRKQMGMTQ